MQLNDSSPKDSDAYELKDFIEVEDYCRRTTVASSRATKTTKTPSRKPRNALLMKNHSVVKSKKVTTTRNSRDSHNRNHPYLVKTFAITISKDDEILYN